MPLSSSTSDHPLRGGALRDCGLAHLLRVAALRSSSVYLGDGGGSAMVYSPDNGMLTALLKSDAEEAFLQGMMTETAMYLNAGLLKGALCNSRAANLLALAFPQKLTRGRSLCTFVFSPDAVSPPPLPAQAVIGPCRDMPPEELRSLLLAGTEAEPLLFGAKETDDTVRSLLADENALCLSFDGHAVSLARVLDRTEDTSRIGWVATLPAYRGRGCASLLTGSIARREAESGRLAVLFADFRNMSAIKCYTAAGFFRAATVVELNVPVL